MTTEQDYFSFHATGTLGDQRETMLDNDLHLRSTLGTSRNAWKDGKSGMIHGIASQKRLGVADSMCWPNPDAQGDSDEESATVKDFITLNKKAVQHGMATAHEHKAFRATHDYTKSVVGPKAKTGDMNSFPSNVTFGIPARPSTPINDVLANKYQNDWIKEKLGEKQAAAALAEANKPPPIGKAVQTRTSMLRNYVVQIRDPKNKGPEDEIVQTAGTSDSRSDKGDEDDEAKSKKSGAEGAGDEVADGGQLWQMKKFQKAKSKLDTRRPSAPPTKTSNSRKASAVADCQ